MSKEIKVKTKTKFLGEEIFEVEVIINNATDKEKIINYTKRAIDLNIEKIVTSLLLRGLDSYKKELNKEE